MATDRGQFSKLIKVLNPCHRMGQAVQLDIELLTVEEAHGGPGNDINGNTVFFQNLEYPDMGCIFGPTSSEYQTYTGTQAGGGLLPCHGAKRQDQYDLT